MNRNGVMRARWAAIGAAIAVSLGAGGFAVTHAAISSGERAVFVAIAPCRLLDTRPDSQIGPRGSALVADETYTQTVRGANGNCTVPSDAVAVAMNVTSVGGSAGSYLTVWPSDVGKPLVSSLNWAPGAPPTPNKVDVRLSADGKVNFYNFNGSVHLLADIVGYYVDHNHDDRYLRKQGSVVIGHPMFVAGVGNSLVLDNGCMQSTQANTPLEAAVALPVGVTITGLKAFVIDGDGANNLTVTLFRTTVSVDVIASASSAGTPVLTTLTATPATPEVVDSGEYFFVRYSPGPNPGAMDICGVEISYA